ncbi:MAG: DUF2911 domain-containing protein [Acidobacteriia bacterium]|nr:DUF2911 domain-containing protein [Terriglobia bacterium]
MKSGKFFTSLLLGVVMAMAATASAAEKATLELRDAVTVNGKQVPAGKYTLTWEDSGPNVELKFLKGKNVIVTTTAQEVSLATAALRNAIVTKDGDSPLALTQLQFAGKKYALAISADSVQTAADTGQK